jgi:uncharacterized protein YjaZ
MKTVSYSFVVLILVSCQSKRSDFERSILLIHNQRFEILTAHRIFKDYLSEKTDYTGNIRDPIEREFGQHAEYPFLLDALKKEIKPDERLDEELGLLQKTNFSLLADSVLKIVTKKLLGPDTKILFMPANPEFREMFRKFGTGMHAITVGTGRIIVTVDPTFADWQKMLPYALAHEYHHSVWTSRNFKTSNFTPLEYIVLEGKAESFAMELFPNDSHPFLKKLTEAQERKIWNLILPDLNKRNSPTNDKIMYGTNEIPYGSVYAIGFSIIKAFRKYNPHISTKKLLDLSAEQVLIMSKYNK